MKSRNVTMVALVCAHCGETFSIPRGKLRERQQRAPRGVCCSVVCARRLGKPDAASRFWERTDQSLGPNTCWPWLGSFDKDGYGSFWIDGESHRTNRVAYFLTHGEWPLVARHSCDNPPCCNPLHILDGTTADNIRDRDSRGRHWVVKGEEHVRAKLTIDDVQMIRLIHRTAFISQSEIARLFDVMPMAIHDIVRRITWKHVP